MGASLTRAAQWTPASSGGGVGGTGTLEVTPINESLLADMLTFVEQFGPEHPLEAAHVFKEPLRWTTALAASDFNEDYDISGADVQSQETGDDGRPSLRISPPTVSVETFSQLSKLAQLSGAKGPAELRACLEENRGLVVKILGPSFAAVLEGDADTSTLQLDDQQRADQQLAEDCEVKVKLYLLLQHLDDQLLSSTLTDFSKEVGLSPSAVKNEVELLKGFCSEGNKRVLKSVRYTSGLN
ncbi:hypothetical protein NHX12_021513 [Muraenolepis orangiensis]|uniref:Uncharacterized protein n=1 Tax=Muraenolepis orangiensis TaxID=630683 RepID=A0A9Q0ES97_9TELE|nr:hypothetical protein NHX12_021513 [Muraenolepis orangiensis]